MRALFRACFTFRHHWAWVLLVLFGMLGVTISNQLEIIGVGIITKTAPKLVQSSSSTSLLESAYKQADAWFSVDKSAWNAAFFMLAIAAFKAVMLFWHRFSTKLLAIRLSFSLRQIYFEHLESLPMRFFHEHHIGSLSSRVVSDATVISEAINSSLTNYLQTPFTVISTLILCLLTSWQLTLMVFLGFPAIVLPIYFLAKQIKRLSKQMQKNQERFASVLIDFLAGIQTVKLFGMEEQAFHKYSEQNRKMAELETRSTKYDVASRPIVHTIAMIFLAASLIIGLYVLELSVSDVLVFSGLLYIFYEPIKKFAEENGHIQKGVAAAERMLELMQLPKEANFDKGTQEISSFQDSIEFDRVWFRYGSSWVLKDVSFRIKKGQKVAIVGPTGAGKSTIAQLLPRLFEIEKGTISIDGQPIQTYTQKSLRELIAFVPQKSFLFADTIAENISFGRQFSQEAIKKAANQAHAHFIEDFPESYDTLLSEGGKNLSGGQQQRIAIARGLVKGAPLLVMDEATSSLDALSELAIKQALAGLKGQVTQLIIAHRLSTIEDADVIIVIDNGEKIGEGNKDFLLQNCPLFRKMWDTLHQSSPSSSAA